MGIGDGPAAVIGDEGREMPLAGKAGKARSVGRSGSQKTCLDKLRNNTAWTAVRLFNSRNYPRMKKGLPDRFYSIRDFFLIFPGGYPAESTHTKKERRAEEQTT